MKDLLIVINTCRSYFANVENLIDTISKSTLDASNILIVSGQEDEESTSYIDGIKIVRVPFTGLHHTGAIYVCEHLDNFSQFNYFLLLPDTIKMGPNFPVYLQRYYTNMVMKQNIPVMSLINPQVRPSMDMCIASKPHLGRMSHYLKQIKQEDTSRPALLRLKQQLIFDENMILGIHVKGKNVTRHKPILENTKLVSIVKTRNGIRQRRLEGDRLQEVYLVPLDLYKYQRNFKGPHKPLVLEL